MKRFSSIHIAAYMLAMLVPSFNYAITATRVSEINQFMADLKKGTMSADAIQKRQAELKKGISARELNFKQFKDMDKEVQAALQAKKTATPPTQQQGQKSTTQPTQQQGTKPSQGMEEEEDLGSEFQELFGEEQLAVPQISANEAKAIIVLDTPKKQNAAKDIQKITGTNVANKKLEVAEQVVNQYKIKNLPLLKDAVSVSPKQESLVTFEKFQLLKGALETLKEEKPEESKEVLAIEDKPLVDKIRPKLDNINERIKQAWQLSEKPSQDIISKLYKDLGEVQRIYIESGEKSALLAKEIRKSYKSLGLLEVTAIGIVKKMTWDEAAAFLTSITEDNLFEALESKKITEEKYKEILKARLELAIAAKDALTDNSTACGNEKLLVDWDKKLSGYKTRADHTNAGIIKDACTERKKQIKQLEEKQAAEELAQYENVYQAYLKGLGDKKDINLKFMQAARDFQEKLNKVQESLKSNNEILMLDFEPEMKLALDVINREVQGDELKKSYRNTVNNMATQIKGFILEAIKTHRRVTKLQQLPEAVTGNTKDAVAALDLLWTFKAFNLDQMQEGNMLAAILNMIADLQDLELGFKEAKPAINDSVEKEITKELITSFCYVFASFDAMMYKLVTTKQGWAAWMGSWIAYFVPYIGRSFTKGAYYEQFETTLNYVLERINNGIKIFELTCKPLIGNSVAFKDFESGSLVVTTYATDLKSGSDYKYKISTAEPIKEIAPVGTNRKVKLSAPFVITPNHKKNKMTTIRLDGISLSIYSTYTGQIDAIKTAFAQALKGTNAATLFNNEALYNELISGLQTLTKEHNPDEPYAGSDTEQSMIGRIESYKEAIAK